MRNDWKDLLTNRLFGYSFVDRNCSDEKSIAQFNLTSLNNCLSLSFYNFPNEGLLYFLVNKNVENDSDSYNGRLMIFTPGILI